MKKHPKSKLTRLQLAIAAVITQAIRAYSEEFYCAGWLSGIEHLLWDEMFERREDAYEKAAARLYRKAGKSKWRRPKTPSEFAIGLRKLVERYRVWVSFANGGERAIALRDWLPMHQTWTAQEIAQRRGFEEVWRSACFDFRRKDRPTPPMPKIRLPKLGAKE